MSRRQIVWIILFSVALGFFESAVVIYLRELYYPSGFRFPMVLMSPRIGLIEVLREASTIVILLSLGVIGGKNRQQRFALFLGAFAVWDLTYYLFLKILTDWPSGWMTWDLLFLIPLPWIGPVISACIVALLMLFFCIALLHRNSDRKQPLHVMEWVMLAVGSIIIILSWTWDYMVFSSLHGTPAALSEFVPLSFRWYVFGGGYIVIGIGIIRYVWRTRSKLQVPVG